MSKKYHTSFVLMSVIFVAGTVYGILLFKYQVFPYGIIKTACHKIQELNPLKSDGPWSIGMYEGSTLFGLHENVNISNPVLTAKDVVDIDAAFVADPFMVIKNGRFYMFFEVLNRETDQGDIAYSESSDGREWKYKKVVIDEKFHLSYPHVFEWDNTYYMIPESHEDFSVRLYKATEFPEKWEYVGNLLSGYGYVDSSIFRYKNKWWMFVSAVGNNVLNLYFSQDLFKGWQPHPLNPIVKSNEHISRPGGRVILDDGTLLRFAQDDYPGYGIQVFAFEITELSETSYAEKPASEKPIIKGTGTGWNAAGMHQIDLHKVEGRWMAAVDGRNR